MQNRLSPDNNVDTQNVPLSQAITPYPRRRCTMLPPLSNSLHITSMTNAEAYKIFCTVVQEGLSHSYKERVQKCREVCS